MTYDRRQKLSEREQAVIDQAYELIEDIHGETFAEHAKEREPEMTSYALTEGIEIIEHNVPQIDEVFVRNTIHATMTYFYTRYDQNPFERSVYGI